MAEQHTLAGTAPARPRPSVRHRLEYLAVVSVVAAARLLYVCDRSHRRLAIENLRAAFPVRTEGECRAISREMFSHFGRLLAVLLKFSTMRPDEMLQCVEFEGEERVVHAHAQNRGVLLFTGHFGFSVAKSATLPP